MGGACLSIDVNRPIVGRRSSPNLKSVLGAFDLGLLLLGPLPLLARRAAHAFGRHPPTTLSSTRFHTIPATCPPIVSQRGMVTSVPSHNHNKPQTAL